MSIGYPDFGGIAAVNAPVNIRNATAQTIASAGNTQLGPFNMAGQSYSIKFDPQQGVSGTVPFTRLQVQVVDSAGFATEDIFYEVPMDGTINDCAYSMSGPFNGQQIIVTIFNIDTVTMTYNISINSSSTPLTDHTITTLMFNGVGSGLNVAPGSSPRKGLLGTNHRLALGAGGSDSYIIPPSPGRIQLAVFAVTAANVIAVDLAPYVSQNNFTGVTDGNSARMLTDANGNTSLTLPVMRAAYNLKFTNTGSGATDYRWTCVFSTTTA